MENTWKVFNRNIIDKTLHLRNPAVMTECLNFCRTLVWSKTFLLILCGVFIYIFYFSRGATKTVLCICEYHKPMVAELCVRYRGLRPLLKHWEGQGFSRDLRALLRLLEAGDAQRAELEVCFTVMS